MVIGNYLVKLMSDGKLFYREKQEVVEKTNFLYSMNVIHSSGKNL